MNRVLYLTTTVFLSFILSGCEMNGKEIVELRNEVRYLETEISSVRAAPGFTFGEAFDYVDAGDYAEAVNLLSDLKNEFPEWNSDIVTTFLEKYSKMVPEETDTTRSAE